MVFSNSVTLLELTVIVLTATKIVNPIMIRYIGIIGLSPDAQIVGEKIIMKYDPIPPIKAKIEQTAVCKFISIKITNNETIIDITTNCPIDVIIYADILS